MSIFRKFAVAATLIAAPSLASAAEGWNGFYAGAHVASTDTELSFAGLSGSENSNAAGLHLGYNYGVSGNLVLGGELNYFRQDGTDLGIDGDLTTQRAKIRIGYDLGILMLYGVLGYAQIGDGTDDEDGSTYGVGLDYKITDSLILGAEILRDAYSVEGIDLDVTSFNLRISYKF
jgi:opacity protein-like surface antigen